MDSSTITIDSTITDNTINQRSTDMDEMTIKINNWIEENMDDEATDWYATCTYIEQAHDGTWWEHKRTIATHLCDMEELKQRWADEGYDEGIGLVSWNYNGMMPPDSVLYDADEILLDD